MKKISLLIIVLCFVGCAKQHETNTMTDTTNVSTPPPPAPGMTGSPSAPSSTAPAGTTADTTGRYPRPDTIRR